MYKKTLHLALVAILVLGAVNARKLRKNKRPKSEDEDSTPQPSVVSYSTFGVNDVGTYDGFVPSSPDYVNYLSNFNEESSTRLYAPAFPTALESSGFGNNYGSQAQDGPNFNGGDGSAPQASMLQYPQSSVSFFNTPNLDTSEAYGQAAEEIYGRNIGEVNSPVYGTKIGAKNKYTSNSFLNNSFNNSEFNVFSSGNGASSPGDDKYSSFHSVQSSYESKPSSFGEPNKNYKINYNNYAPTYPSTGNEDFIKSSPSYSQSQIKYPKVIDFTKFKQYYPTDLDNKITTTTNKPRNLFKPNTQNENPFTNNFESQYKTDNKFVNTALKFRDTFKHKDVEEGTEKETTNPISYSSDSNFSHNYFNDFNQKNPSKESQFNFDFKDKFKYNRPWASKNYTNDYKNSKNPYKGYQYSTDHSNMSFEFDFSGPKKPTNTNIDEIVPASSNVVDLTSYQFPETDYSNFKKFPAIAGNFGDDYSNFVQSLKTQDGYDPEEYIRSIYSTVPTTTSNWGNIFKTSEYTSHKQHAKRPQFHDDITDEVVHIPKRPYSNKYNFGKLSEYKPTDWSTFTNHRPYKQKKPQSDWNKEVSSTRFKSEEDLLGLRTHDTSHPSYLPTYRPSSNSLSNDYDYKKLVDKWKQSYLKAKYKDSLSHDFDGFSSETKPRHVPVPKPYSYPIEVPHPVIVPVPQPYPVRVPIPKPVAVPVIRELTLQIEKPVPYPVIKNVPYPIEKPVPVRVEKEVQVPVVKPYPVHIPHIKPVFHHSRPRDEADAAIDVDEEDDYMPRPETSKRIPYVKRPRASRNRPRRPSRPTYHDRNRRRWPARRPGPPQRYPRPTIDHSPPKHQEEDFEQEYSDYFTYCKRTGNC